MTELCPRCDGDGFGGDWRESNCAVCGGRGKVEKNPAAVTLGRLGGQTKSPAKAQSSRENGKKGGRPKMGNQFNVKDWHADPDWSAVAMSAAHRLHHIGIDSEGNYYCRECSRDRIYLLRRDEIDRLLLQDRVKV